MIGQYRHRVTIQQATVSRNDRGAEVLTWSTWETVYANIRTITASERQALGEQPLGVLLHQVDMRYRSGVLPKMRLVWGTRIFDIEGVAEMDNRQRSLRLYCQEIVGDI